LPAVCITAETLAAQPSKLLEQHTPWLEQTV